jgi:hypothetical protein
MTYNDMPLEATSRLLRLIEIGGFLHGKKFDEWTQRIYSGERIKMSRTVKSNFIDCIPGHSKTRDMVHRSCQYAHSETKV